MFYLTEPFNIAAARRAYRQMTDCWKAIYTNALLRDVPVSGARMEISFEFGGGPNGGIASLQDCFKAVSWYFSDIAGAFRALASRTAALTMKTHTVARLFSDIDSRFLSSVAVFQARCRGRHETRPSTETVKLLCELHNDLGLNMCTG